MEATAILPEQLQQNAGMVKKVGSLLLEVKTLYEQCLDQGVSLDEDTQNLLLYLANEDLCDQFFSDVENIAQQCIKSMKTVLDGTE